MVIHLDKAADKLADELRRAYEDALRGPFPYAECRALVRSMEGSYEGFVPDLDMYFYGIASACNGARKLLNAAPGELHTLQQRLSRSFFEQHPEYCALESRLTKVDSPRLYQELALHEDLRGKLLELLDLLRSGSDERGREVDSTT